MIQIKTFKNNVLYELEQSELFPDFSSVLKDAIVNQIDLQNLYIESENLDHIVWNTINIKNLKFKNCSMVGGQFTNCYGDHLTFENCNITRLKIKKSKIEDLSIRNCKASSISIRNSCLLSSTIELCECISASFDNSNLLGFRFYSCNLSESFFYKCNLNDAHFVNNIPDHECMLNIYFIECSVKKCEMLYVENLSLLYFWKTDMRDIEFLKNEYFVEVINPLSRLIYALNSDVVWWKPYSWEENVKGIFRGSLKEFKDEVDHGFPTTDLYPNMNDYEIEEELIRVIKYLEMWLN